MSLKNRHTLNCITINTDASFHQEEKVSGYAFYIVCDHFKIQISGTFKVPPLTIEEAEIMCIGNAIAVLLKQEELPTSRLIVINNDSLGAMEKIRKSKTSLGGKVNNLLYQLRDRLQSKKPQLRHVKAHSGIKDARSWVNEWCDTEAKKEMRKALQEKLILTT